MTDGPVDHAAIYQIVTFFSLIAGFVYQAYRENRQRRWDLEDRKELASALAATSIKVDRHAQLAAASRAEMATALEVNTVLTQAAITSADNAFHEANSVNVKIHRLAESANAAIQLEKLGERRASDHVRADVMVAADLGLRAPGPHTSEP
jgi:hypothetical protein